MNLDNIKLVPVTLEFKKKLENLMALYLHELSEYSDDLKVNEEGFFEYDGLEYYFNSGDLKPFFIYVEDEIAGFVLLNSGRFVPIAIDYSVHEFFILKSFRKKGVGSAAIKKVLELYKGKYKIVELKGNAPAIGFWRSFYRENNITYSEFTENSDGLECIMQIFDIN